MWRVDPESRTQRANRVSSALMPDSWIITITAGAAPTGKNALDEALQVMTCNEVFLQSPFMPVDVQQSSYDAALSQQWSGLAATLVVA